MDVQQIEKLYKKSANLRQTDGSLLEHIKSLKLRYLSQEVVGEGAMKRIVTTRDEATGRLVAMALQKNLQGINQSAQIENFLREARITAYLQHPNIVPVYDIGWTEDNGPFFTMKFLGDKHLGQVFSELDQDSRIEIFKKVCDAMSYAHSRGVIHLDLKPDNIQIGEYGEVTICDWGLAKLVFTGEEPESLLDEDLLDSAELNLITKHGEIKGTPGFMSPEQLKSSHEHKDQRCDIYALGAILYTLLSGESPLQNRDFNELRERTIEGNIPAPSEIKDDIPGSLEAICLKAMKAEASQRYTSVSELINDLEAYQHGYATGAEEASVLRILGLFIRRHLVVCSLLLIFVLASVVYVALFINQQNNNLIQISQQKDEAKRLQLEAEKNLKDYLDEKKISGKFSRDLAESYRRKAEENFRTMNFNISMNNAKKAHELNPNDQEINSLMGKLLFLQYRFKEAISFFQKGTKFNDEYYSERSRDLAKHIDKNTGKLTEERFLKLMEITWPHNTVTRYMMRDMVASRSSLESKVQLVKKLLIIRNPQITELNFHFQAETLSLNLSSNPRLDNIDPLATLPLRKLDLSKSAVHDFSALKGKSIEELNLSGTAITDIRELKLKKLRYLDISSTKYEKLSSLLNLPLEFLDMRNCAFRYPSQLNQLKKLKTVILSKEIYTADEIKALKMKVNLSPN